MHKPAWGNSLFFLKTNPRTIHSRIYPKAFLTNKSEKMKKGSFILSAALALITIAGQSNMDTSGVTGCHAGRYRIRGNGACHFQTYG
jgi:hypothetical protein